LYYFSPPLLVQQSTEEEASIVRGILSIEDIDYQLPIAHYQLIYGGRGIVHRFTILSRPLFYIVL